MTRRIKILFTIPNFDTAGSGKVVYDLVKGLDKSIFDPEICCFHNKGSFFKDMESLGVKIHLFSFAAPYRPFITFPFRLYKIYKFFKKQQFDLIHSWHWSSDFSEPLAAKLVGIPFVYTKKAMGWGNKAWHYRSKLSTKIITINSDMMTQFFSNMPDKILFIPLGVDTEYFRPMPKSYIIPEGDILEKSDFVIISVANLVPVKGIENLIEAVNLLDDPNIKTFIIGDDNNEYAKELKSKYSNERVYFIGKKTDVRPYLSIADIFVIPTKDEGRKEGLPIAPIEAMASQRVVIGSNISGINDILRSFPECLFEAGDVTDLSRKIKDVVEMPYEMRNELAFTMRQCVEEQYTIKKCLEKHQNLYKKMI